MPKPIDKLNGISCPHCWSRNMYGISDKPSYSCNLFMPSETESDEPCSILDAYRCILSLNPNTVDKMRNKAKKECNKGGNIK